MTQPGDSAYDFAPAKTPPSALPKVKAEHGPAQARICPICGTPAQATTRRSRCPKCRTPLEAPVPQLLRESDPVWLREIAWGPLVMSTAVALHIGGALITQRVGGHPGQIASGAFHTLAAVLLAVGTWMLTSVEPGKKQPRRWAAIASRGLTAAAILLWAGVWLFTVMHSSAASWFLALALILMAVESVTIGLFAGGMVSRIPHEGMANQLRHLALIMPAFFAALLWLKFFVDINDYYKIFFLSYPLIGGMLGVTVWLFLALVRLTYVLRRAARVAEKGMRGGATVLIGA